MPLDLQDGYTLPFTASRDGIAVTGTYRPALWPALTEYRRQIGTAGEVPATVKVIKDHVVTWDVTKGGKPAAIDDAAILALPDWALDQILGAVITWAPKSLETAEKNSVSG